MFERILIFNMQQEVLIFMIKDVPPTIKLKKLIENRFSHPIEKVGAQRKKRPCIGSITARDPYPKINLGMEGSKKVHLSGAQFVKRTFYIHRLDGYCFSLS